MITVRGAKREDSAVLARIMVSSFRAGFGEIISRETMEACADLDHCTRMFEGLFDAGGMHFLLGELDGKACGEVVWADSGEILAVHSLQESWGSGLGAAMLERAMEDMRANGLNYGNLWAFAENRRGRRFYEKHGFRWDGSQRVSEFDGAMEVRYERKL